MDSINAGTKMVNQKKRIIILMTQYTKEEFKEKEIQEWLKDKIW